MLPSGGKSCFRERGEGCFAEGKGHGEKGNMGPIDVGKGRKLVCCTT